MQQELESVKRERDLLRDELHSLRIEHPRVEPTTRASLEISATTISNPLQFFDNTEDICKQLVKKVEIVDNILFPDLHPARMILFLEQSSKMMTSLLNANWFMLLEKNCTHYEKEKEKIFCSSCITVLSFLLGRSDFLPFSEDIFSWNENGDVGSYSPQFLNMMNSLVDKRLWVHVDQKHKRKMKEMIQYGLVVVETNKTVNKRCGAVGSLTINISRGFVASNWEKLLSNQPLIKTMLIRQYPSLC